MLTSVILSLPLWKNKMAELTCIPVYEQGEGNGTQKILTTGGLGDEDKGK